MKRNTVIPVALAILFLLVSPANALNITLQSILGDDSLTVHPSASAGNYVFSQVGNGIDNDYVVVWGLNQTLHPFEPNSFAVTIDAASPTSEPTTLFLVGAALLGLVVLGRKFAR